MSGELLRVTGLSVRYKGTDGDVLALRDVSYEAAPGEILGIVGESGSGKSTSVYALTRLLPANAEITGGSVTFEGTDMLGASQEEIRKLMGSRIGMVFQDSMQCLDPSFRIGDQLIEAVRVHDRSVSRAAARDRAEEMLTLVHIDSVERVMRSYPFELSGGMCQRVMIAMALINDPALLIADEPTTALDVTIQDRIVGLIRERARSRGTAVVFITHNFGIVADIGDRVCVMYGGRIMESGTVSEIFYEAAHPYTRGLLEAIPGPYAGDKSPMASIEGDPADLRRNDPGCPFAPRCAYASALCRSKLPEPFRLSGTHTAACHLCAVPEGTAGGDISPAVTRDGIGKTAGDSASEVRP